MIRIKGCRRCGGDLSLEFDIYGVYATCIQCGASWSKGDMVIPDYHTQHPPAPAVSRPGRAPVAP